MPIQEGEEASGRPAAKAKPILKPASTSSWNFIPIEQRKWIDIEVPRSKDLCCFQMSKFITKLLRHREVGWEEDARVPFDKTILRNAKKKLSKDSKNGPNEAKQDLKMAKRWWSKEKVSILFETR